MESKEVHGYLGTREQAKHVHTLGYVSNIGAWQKDWGGRGRFLADFLKQMRILGIELP